MPQSSALVDGVSNKTATTKSKKFVQKFLGLDDYVRVMYKLVEGNKGTKNVFSEKNNLRP